MRIATSHRLVPLILAATFGCGPREPLTVSAVQVGRALNSDNSIAAHTTRFAPEDTIYTSVLTERPGTAALTVRWLYSGRLVSEVQKTVSYTREAATEFHIQNSGGFPAGEYQVEIFVNGKRWGVRGFRVE